MNSDKQRLGFLLTLEQWTPEEERWIAERLLSPDNEEFREQYFQRFQADLAEGKRIGDDISRRLKNRIASRLSLEIPPTETKVISWKKPVRWLVAAAVTGIILIAGYFSATLPKPERLTLEKGVPSAPINNDVAPGGQKATLTLSDGSQIVLDSASNGTLVSQGQSKVIKLSDGQLVYRNGPGNDAVMLYNTMTTPRGGQYQLTLPDGTAVWLNAASSITYPVSFTGPARTVTISGEAYFEVMKQSDPRTHLPHPFRVKADNVTIEVLGTHFNINSYHDESVVKTTLLEGSVRVWKDAVSGMLRPGEQSQIGQNGAMKIVKEADLEETMAWKNGLFYFNNANVQTVMRQLMRWYDVDVKYEGDIPVREFQGEIQKNLNLSQVLKILGKMEVNFRLEGKKLTVLP